LIVTGKLELRPFRPEDAAELHEIFSDPETHTIGQGPFTSLIQTAAWISRRAETERQHGLLWYAVRARDDDRILGNCGLFTGRTGSGLSWTTPWPAASAACGQPSGRTTPRPCASRPRSG
jgi:RimJ/RimL family protein N-acetyltransferase